MGRTYTCRVSNGEANPTAAGISFNAGLLHMNATGIDRMIDLLNVDAVACEDVKIGLRLYPQELLVIEWLGRDIEMFCEELKTERRRRLLSGLFQHDSNPSKPFPCSFAIEGEPQSAEIEIYPTSLMFYPNTAPPFHIPLSYIQAEEFDRETWTVNLRLIEGTNINIRKLAMLTDEFRTLWATAMDNHRARSDRLRSLLNVKNAILPGIPMTGQGNVTEFLRHPCMLRRKEGLYLASHGTAWLCANELNAGLAEATDTHGIPDDEELIANTVIYLMIRAGDWLIVEVLNKEDYATYLFRWGEVAALYPAMRFERVFVMHIARAFDSINFRREPVYEKADTLQEKYGIQIDAIERKNPSVEVLRKRFAGRIIHTAGWQSELDRLLT